MLLSRGDSGSGSKTEQSVALLEQKWHAVSSKVEERKVPLQSTVWAVCSVTCDITVFIFVDGCVVICQRTYLIMDFILIYLTVIFSLCSYLQSFAGVYNIELRRWGQGNVRNVTSNFLLRNFTEDQKKSKLWALPTSSQKLDFLLYKSKRGDMNSRFFVFCFVFVSVFQIR